MKHPGGRPPKPPEERLTYILRVRVTAAQADKLYRLARHQKQDLGALLRRILERQADSSCSPETSEA